MVWYTSDEEPESFIFFEPNYNSDDIRKTTTFLFDFEMIYTRVPDADSDGDEDLDNLETRTIRKTHEFDRNWLLGGGDKDQITANVFYILDMIEIPCYTQIVTTLTLKILNLKKRVESSTISRIKVVLDVMVWRFPGEDVEDDNVNFAVAPASEEAVERHLQTVTVESEGYCVICMDTIKVGSDTRAGRMPCMHEFHRPCGENWLRSSSGVCPICRDVFPS